MTLPDTHRVIDAHVNITENGSWFRTGHDASVGRLLAEMDESSIEKALVVSMPGASSNRHVAATVRQYPDRFKCIGHIDFSGTDLPSQVDNLLDMGFCGVKVHPRFQKVDLCDPAIAPLWQRLNELRCILMIDGYCQTTPDGLRIEQLLPFYYETLVRRFPGITFIFAHAGFHRVLDTLQLCRSYPNFHCDISYSLIAAKGASFYNDFRYLIKRADRKVLFGSDFPEFKIADALRCCMELLDDAGDEKMRHVLSENGCRILWNKEQP